MIVKYIRHFLTEEGAITFPQWLTGLQQAISQTEGYLSLHYFYDTQDPTQVHFFLYFDNKEALCRWICSTAHEQVVEQITRMARKDWIAEEYQIGASA